MNLPDEHFHIIENYIDPEYCKVMADYFTNNMEEDPREFYGTFGLGNKDYFFNEKNPSPKIFDPEMKLYEMVQFGHKFFAEHYPMYGEFELNRSHANLMFPGAELHSHKDDRNWDEPIEGLPSRTHVMGLFLTDDYEGGELTFEEQNVVLKPKVGTLVFFPGYYTRHGVNKVTSGTRINILTHYFDIIDRDNVNPAYPA
jgi:hypothetical protein